jgi:hypothetical protein
MATQLGKLQQWKAARFSAAPHNSHHFVKPVFPAVAMQMIILIKHNSIEAYTP